MYSEQRAIREKKKHEVVQVTLSSIKPFHGHLSLQEVSSFEFK